MQPLKSYSRKESWKKDWEQTKKDGKGLAIKAGIAIAPSAAIVTAYTAATLALNIIAAPVLIGFNGIERTLDWSRTTQTVTLEDKEWMRGYQMYVAKITVSDEKGEKFNIFDRYDYLEGKILPGQVMKQMEVGKQYDVELTHSLMGTNILSAKKAVLEKKMNS